VETLLIVLCAVVVLLAVVVFSPVMIAVDSRNRQVRVRWLFAMEFQAPLPWTPGRKRFTLFHRPIPLGERATPAQPAEAKEEPAGKPKHRRRNRAMGRFFVRCLGDSTIRQTLAKQVAKFIMRVAGSVRMSRLASDISLPDPGLNGMLAGALAAYNWGVGERRKIQVNFTGENSLFLELRFHPHRVFKAFLLCLPGLPYRAVFRKWRAFAAAHPR